jgi:hypothetical protein
MPWKRIPLPQRTGVKSEISSSLQIGSLRQPTLPTPAQSSRRAKGSPQVRELAARPLLRGTVRPSDRRGLSLPSPTNLDRPARRSIETDSAFHRMSQINGTLLHVSGSARPESCWPPDTRSPGDCDRAPSRQGLAATSIQVRGQAYFSCRGVILIRPHNSDLIGLIPSREWPTLSMFDSKRGGIPAPSVSASKRFISEVAPIAPNVTGNRLSVDEAAQLPRR